MYNHKNISKLIYSIISSLVLLALFIFVLPLALALVVAFILFSILAGIIFRFILAKKGVKINFSYKNQVDKEETSEMKDVTNTKYHL